MEKREVGAELEALLRPSLAGAPAQLPYSLYAGFLVSFFGGAYAALGFFLLCSRRVGRLRSDAGLVAALAVLWTAVLVWAGMQLGRRGVLPSWLPFTAILGAKASYMRHVSSAAGLLLFGVHHRRLRPFYRATQLLSEEPPSPWQAGIAVCLASYVLGAAALAAGALAVLW